MATGSGIKAFCQVSKHASEEDCPGSQFHPGLPKGWRMVRARTRDGKWHYDPTSKAQIPVCPLHKVEGE